ncbi:hypothetical protein BCR32DRAFT_325578 [Anaeromyces robustus]|jgi:uncharacterized protein YxjI|uniref:DUF567-domain-containing protein n=1 Tax=Anaeromyces robustus TaxID=1754192 RepID=A0A1Y1XHH6_9FUNG|nr:hypothetical protein BCR32DRAFT_325578 [Anaeromyces robustus]|eukprot:ORX85208.1 hypothetical protein BCR32DRAFT_325578 [Anaeromyces robustus]
MNAEVSVVKPETVILTTDERYIKDEVVILVLNEKISFNGATCTIKDTNKNEYFKCKDKSVCFTDGKILKDVNGAKVIGIKSDSLLSFKQEIYNPNKNKKLAKVTKENILSVKCLVASFQNKATHKSETLVMKFNPGSKNCNIYYGKNEKAPLVGKLVFKSSLIGKNKYYLEVAPKVDLALMSCLAIAFDIYKNE